MVTEAEALDFIARWQTAAESEEWPRVEELLHPSAMVRFNDGDHTGPAIRAAFEGTWALDAGADERYAVSDTRVVHLGEDSATVAFSWRWSGASNGEPFEVGGRGTSVIVRTDAGLQLVLEHLSRD
jgi:hypothetical protein